MDLEGPRLPSAPLATPLYIVYVACQGFLEVFGVFFFGGGGRVHLGGGEHSVEDHYLHIMGIIFWGESPFFVGGGDSPPPKKKPGLQEALRVYQHTLYFQNTPNVLMWIMIMKMMMMMMMMAMMMMMMMIVAMIQKVHVAKSDLGVGVSSYYEQDFLVTSI